MKPRVYVCGHFANNLDCFDGQTVKTREIYNILVEKYKENRVEIIDSGDWKKHPIKLLKTCVEASKKADDLIILPARRGVKIFVPLFVYLKKKYKFKLHYVVIGGWLYEILKSNKWLLKRIRNVDYIYVESHGLIKKMNELKVYNVFYMVNFKNLKKPKMEKRKNINNNLRCCIFSRIEEDKGVLDAIEVVNKNNRVNDKRILLDIYGKVDADFEEKFFRAIIGNKNIKYLGPIDPQNSAQTIKNYDLLLFPTKHKTEGIPGTIIDAYFAGVPVLASKWDNYNEIIIDDKTGFGYEFDDVDDFYDKLLFVLNNSELLSKMRNNCLFEAEKFSPECAIKVLLRNIGR